MALPVTSDETVVDVADWDRDLTSDSDDGGDWTVPWMRPDAPAAAAEPTTERPIQMKTKPPNDVLRGIVASVGGLHNKTRKLMVDSLSAMFTSQHHIEQDGHLWRCWTMDHGTVGGHLCWDY